jgi:hypothetical protein
LSERKGDGATYPMVNFFVKKEAYWPVVNNHKNGFLLLQNFLKHEYGGGWRRDDDK